MNEKVTCRVDAQGRIMIPAHIRKAINLETGDEMTLSLDPFHTIHLEAANNRCCLCGEFGTLSVTIGPSKKHICSNCAHAIRKAVK